MGSSVKLFYPGGKSPERSCYPSACRHDRCAIRVYYTAPPRRAKTLRHLARPTLAETKPAPYGYGQMCACAAADFRLPCAVGEK